MKKWILHILLFASLFSMLTTSCSQEEGLEPQVNTKKVQVSFSIELDTPTARSRVGEPTWGDNYDAPTGNDYQSETGDAFENHIDPELLYAELTLFSSDKKESSNCVVKKVRIFETTRPNVYEFIGEANINEDLTDFSFARLNVYANYDISDDDNIFTFGTNYTSELKGKGVKNIPMWGVKTIDNFTSLSGGIKDFGPIYLLRAMAKIEVSLDEDLISDGYSLHNAYLGKYNAIGIIQPKDFSNFENTLNIDTIFSFNKFEAPENSTSTVAQSDGLPFVKSGNNRYIVYVPEYVYENEDLILVEVTKKINGKEEHILKVEKGENGIPDYKTNPGFPMNITNLVRNHLYRYNITKINDGASLELTCNVKPWDVETEEWDFTENISESEFLNWGEQGLTINDKGEVIIPNTNEYTCTFGLLTPTDGTWQASLIPVGGVTDAFEFVGNNSGIIGKTGTGQVTLTIKAKYADVYNENNAAKLRIVVRTKDGRTLVANLTGNDNFTEYTLVQNVNKN